MSETMVPSSESVSPLKVAAFRRLFTAQVVALVGTGLTTVALTLLAYDKAGGQQAAAVLGTALAVKMVAYVLFAPVVGGLAHRFARKPFLISMDVVRASLILAMPWVTEIWQIYVLIFLLNVFSAGFKPVFSATIPDLLPDERQYTRALSLSRLAYDLEDLLSPSVAAIALLYFSYTGLFVANAVAFVLSALLILLTAIPRAPKVWRTDSIVHDISFGVRAYLKTPRLRGLLALYLGVASASAAVIVNTVVYVRGVLGGTETQVALAFAASGAGSMLAALVLPRLLDRCSDRSVMLSGSGVMALGLGLMATGPSLLTLWPIWFLTGVGWSLVQTPAGRVVNRSSNAEDRTAYFSAQFALSHACWLVFYAVVGHTSSAIGVPQTALYLSLGVVVFTWLASRLWPKADEALLMHRHASRTHEHLHVHDLHHDHVHEGWEGPEPHSHAHKHKAIRHEHPFVIDSHHSTWPQSS